MKSQKIKYRKKSFGRNIGGIQTGKELKTKILKTLGILVFLRILASIPTPGVNTDYFKNTDSFINMLSGNGLDDLSIMALSITPYITGSIIMQLMAVVFPRLHELQTGMQKERDFYEKLTFIVGAVMALIQAFSFGFGFGRQGLLLSFTWYWVALTTVIWTLGAVLSAFLGKYISDKLFGNGVSLILLTNILSAYPGNVYTLYEMFIKSKKMAVAIGSGVVIVLLVILMFAFTTFTQDCEKNLPVTYSGRMGIQVNKIPIKMCQGGVVPIIFASSLISFPVMIAQAFGKGDNVVIKVLNTSDWFKASEPIFTVGAILYLLMIFGFTYFYAEITFNPLEIANNLKTSGGMIKGIRPGKPTSDYIKGQTKWLYFLGASAMSVIALIPIILSGVFGISKLSFLGTSIIITIGVFLETRKTLTSQTKMESYTKRGGIFGV